MNKEDDVNALFVRSRMPEELGFLLKQHPRDSWRSSPDLTSMGRFWLKRHNMFRELGGALSGSILQLKEDTFNPQTFAQWFAPRLNFLLSELEGHHHIEDAHYFPVFVSAEPRLKRGFEILDRDHHHIHDLLERNANAGWAFAEALAQGGDRMRFAADTYGGEADHLVTGLMRHLEDEEDLIIPLLIDRNENGQSLM